MPTFNEKIKEYETLTQSHKDVGRESYAYIYSNFIECLKELQQEHSEKTCHGDETSCILRCKDCKEWHV